MIVRMCEMVSHPEALDDLVRWICDVGVPELEGQLGHVESEVFASADHRVVVISRWRSDPRQLADPPPHFIKRPPLCWDFSPVDR